MDQKYHQDVNGNLFKWPSSNRLENFVFNIFVVIPKDF